METFEDFLEHYGVKGMKWGVRKSRTSRAQTRYSKPANKLTDAELQKRIKRLETERKYNQLNRRTVGEGEKLVAEILTNSGRKVATTVITNAATIGVGALIASRFGENAGSAVIKKLK